MTRRETEIVRWLVDNGFPFDWHSLNPAPQWLRRPVAEEWARRDDEPVENYLWALNQEQKFADRSGSRPRPVRSSGDERAPEEAGA